MGSIFSLLRPDDNSQSDMPGSFVPPRRVPTEATEGNSLEPRSRIYPSLVGLTDMRTLENDFRTLEPSSRRHSTSHREGGYDDDSMMLIESTTALRPSSSSERNRISREEHDYEMADDETMMLTERMRNLQTSSSPASTSSTPESLKRKSPPSHLVTPTKRQKQPNAPRVGRSHSVSPPKARKAKARVSLPVNSGSRYSPIEVDEDEGTEEHRESSDVDMDQNPDESVNPQNDIQLEDILESCLREPAVTIPSSSEYTVPGLSSSITLRDHQISGIMWMRDREESRAKGGILADEMGLGKTLQTFCIIAEDVKKPSSTRHMPTLITSPIAILPQWKSELRRYESTDLKLGIVVYHGKERKDISE
ncbi:hypothetical protein VKT23_009336 [Stygiomarasmius scandens]|uniref:SNF2 N-terminal domain-containing protein n=1 Tax=Marasmiellus scandens TaxID=2682957 RepID=A0ABR1JF44_9AGAR